MNKMKKVLALVLVLALGITALVGCSGGDKKEEPENENAVNIIDDNYRTYYEVFVYSFYDSDGDGIGDIPGLIEKLDYINDGNPETTTDLECNGMWLMPIHQANSYHKYDVMDYYSIDKQYGTLDDFKKLVEECDKRGIKLIIDLVMNHSSDKHEWFTTASEYLAGLEEGQEPDPSECKYVDYYHFAKGKPATGAYAKVPGTMDWWYECVFVSEMPDLNLENEDVRKEFEEISKFWLDLGVGGFRLDAVKHFQDGQDAYNIEVLKWFNDYVKGYKEDAYIVGEVYDGIGLYAKYLESGIDSTFDFDMATSTGYIAQTINGKLSDTAAANWGKKYVATIEAEKAYNEDYIMAPFISNHDVDRIAPGYAYDAGKIKMAIGMLHMMNGSTFLYYGDEVGLGGSGIDQNKRAPMPWSSTNTTGITNGPGAMQADMVINKFASVEDQIKDPESIFNYARRTIRLRNKYPEIARGDVELIETDNIKTCVMKNTYNESSIIIVMNTTNKDQVVNIPKDAGYSKVKDTVAADSTKVATLDGETLTMPAYSIAILK